MFRALSVIGRPIPNYLLLDVFILFHFNQMFPFDIEWMMNEVTSKSSS